MSDHPYGLEQCERNPCHFNSPFWSVRFQVWDEGTEITILDHTGQEYGISIDQILYPPTYEDAAQAISFIQRAAPLAIARLLNWED